MCMILGQNPSMKQLESPSPIAALRDIAEDSPCGFGPRWESFLPGWDRMD